MPDSVCQNAERARWRLDVMLRRVAARVGNRKAAVGWLARRLGSGPAALETLLYHRRGGARLLRRIERAWAAVLLEMARKDLEELAGDLAGEGHAADLAGQVRDLVAALEAAVEREEEERER